MCGRIFSPRRLCCMFLIVLTVGAVYLAVARPQETQSEAPSKLPSIRIAPFMLVASHARCRKSLYVGRCPSAHLDRRTYTTSLRTHEESQGTLCASLIAKHTEAGLLCALLR